MGFTAAITVKYQDPYYMVFKIKYVLDRNFLKNFLEHKFSSLNETQVSSAPERYISKYEQCGLVSHNDCNRNI